MIPPEPIESEESIAYITIDGENIEHVFLSVCNETLCFLRQEMIENNGNYTSLFTVPQGEKLLLKFEIIDENYETTWYNATGISIIPMIPVGNNDNETPSFTVALVISATMITALIIIKRKNNTLK